MQLTRIALVALLALGGVAQAGPPSQTPPTQPQGGDDAPSDDDYRDVFSEPPPHAHDETPAEASDEEPVTGTGRVGAYSDTDRTTVLRALATLVKTWGRWSFTGGVVVDSVTSASVDVRTSPALGKVDVVTSASGLSSTSGGQMTDTRYLATAGGGWKDSQGHAANVTTSVASERDYQSISGGLNGSIDVLDRNVTLLGGFTLTDNWISSVLDTSLHHKMLSAAWSAGVARVLTPSDALRLRYDGKANEGYQASPYRAVRFGDWTTTTMATGQITFANTIGPTGGLAERLPQSRIGHALTLEWVHALGLGVGLHPAVRVARDSWGIESVTPSLDLRIARPTWRMALGYRFYLQSRADFFASKYTQDPAMYSFYTSDKELGRQLGHLGSFEIAKVVNEPESPNDRKLLLFFHADVFRYAYPGFALLPSRVSAFAEIGLGWEL